MFFLLCFWFKLFSQKADYLMCGARRRHGNGRRAWTDLAVLQRRKAVDEPTVMRRDLTEPRLFRGKVHLSLLLFLQIMKRRIKV